MFVFEKAGIICSNLFSTLYWIHFDYFNNKENRFARTADQSAFRKGIKTLTVLNSRYNSRKLGQANLSYDGFITVALDNPLITAHRYSFEHLECVFIRPKLFGAESPICLFIWSLTVQGCLWLNEISEFQKVRNHQKFGSPENFEYLSNGPVYDW